MIFGPLMGLSMFGGMLVGWAKPTPVITRNFRKIVRDDNLTTLAGPVSNLMLVVVAFLVLAVISIAVPGGHQLALVTFMGGLVEGVPSGLQAALMISVLVIEINLMLCIFNLLPIPPLDGSRLMRNMLPYNAVQVYDRIPFWVSYLLMIFVGGTIIWAFVGPAMRLILWGLLHI
jgi:Zn-dependent protease